MLKLKIPLNWFTPSGVQITQEYLKTVSKKVSIKLGGKARTIVIRKFTNVSNNLKQAQAIIPNIIHSFPGGTC